MNDLRTEERAAVVGHEAAECRARTLRRVRQSGPSITARPSAEEKARFGQLARQIGISESALALRAIRTLLSRNGLWLARQPDLKWDQVAASDRITIRLRPGDGLEVIRRATERDMKPATYLSALVRAHITANPPLPSTEVNALKTAIVVLAKLGTMLAKTSRDGIPAGPQGELYRQAFRQTRGEIAALERRIVDLTRAALIAWETRS
jgi:hypothetical protein